jgi:dTDP-4-amino-4,6-dideoxygalactose transaminase
MVKFFDIYEQDKVKFYKNIRDIKEIIKNTNFINGKNVLNFEKNFAKFCNTKYAVGCNSGSDALFLSLKSLNLKKNSEVIIPAQTYCSTLFAVLRADLKPVLVDIQDSNPTLSIRDLKKKITKKTSAIIIVHLYGECCNFKEIKEIVRSKKIHIIEDAAQAHGARDFSSNKKGLLAGSMGILGCFSFYPGKNLGAYGDAGAITTNSKDLYIKLLKLRNLGGIKKYEHDIVGYNSRLDTLQAAILNNKLKSLNNNNLKRLRIAKFYDQNLKNKFIKKIDYSKGCVYHQYVILSKKEKKIKKLLEKNKVQYGKHYPQPIHKLKAVKKIFKNMSFPNAEKFSNYGISLPIDPNLKKNQLLKICNILNSI